MRSSILITLFALFLKTIYASDWSGFKGCGHYEVRGVVRLEKNIPTIILNEATKSQIKITVPIASEKKIAPYIDRPFIAEIKLAEPMNGSIAKGEVQKIDARLANPIDPMDTGLKLLKKSECAK